jgi:hypothetical protein
MNLLIYRPFIVQCDTLSQLTAGNTKHAQATREKLLPLVGNGILVAFEKMGLDGIPTISREFIY